jgi:2-alkyl-3-oxoalkanoate reductase
MILPSECLGEEASGSRGFPAPGQGSIIPATEAIGSTSHAPRLVPPETFERTRLTRAEQTFDRRVTSLYASYLQRDPWFQDANLRALSGRTCPRPDQAFLQRLIDCGIATGYLRGRRVQRTSG